MSLALEWLDMSHVHLGTPSDTAACLKPRKTVPQQVLNGTVPHCTSLYMPQTSVLILVLTVRFGFTVK